MPEVDLKPDDYRVRTRNGRWLSRDDGRIVALAFVMAATMIGFAWWHRSELPLALMFGFTIIIAIAFGMVLGSWLKRFD